MLSLMLEFFFCGNGIGFMEDLVFGGIIEDILCLYNWVMI